MKSVIHTRMNSKIIIDSSVWIALISKEDSCHETAIKAITKLHNTQIVIFDHVYAETLTVLRNKLSEKHCDKFIKLLRMLQRKVTITTQESMTLANSFFFRFKKLSFIDSILLSSSSLRKTRILTFDKNLQKDHESLQHT